MAKYVVKHPKLYFSVNGKKQHCEAGSEVELTEAQAKLMGGKIAPLKAAKSVKADEKTTSKKG